MRLFLVERGTALLAELETLLGSGQLVTQPGVLLTHPLYLRLVLQPVRLEALHVAAQYRHHLATANTSATLPPHCEYCAIRQLEDPTVK